jgi:3-hydroxybutyryl-CoA dehydrogenase
MAINHSQIGVVGAGAMGAGIAQVSAQAGYKTLVYDVSQDFIDRGLGRIRKFLQGSRERGKITGEQEEQILGRLQGSLKLEDLGCSGLVIEAAPENLQIKREVFQKLDTICNSETLLATNTSSLSVTAVATATKSPERVLGMHFFNPPPLMVLVEVIQGAQTDPACIEKAVEIVKRLGKTPVCAKDTPGFVVNRIARPFYNEALRLLDEGDASVETIDKIMKEAGNFRMGPFQLMDLIGIDINFTATDSLYQAFFHDPRFRPSPTQRKMFLAGQLGRKTGRGFYNYESK